MKKILPTLSLAIALALTSQISQSVEVTTQKTTTQTIQTPLHHSNPVTTTTSSTTTSKQTPRQVLNEDALKNMSDSLCSEGFKAYVGSDYKNLCLGRAVSPDLAYSCVWDKAGKAAFEATKQGPCTLDFAEHQESVVVTKTDFKARPPLPYGTEAHCCFRAAVAPVVNVTLK